MAKVGFCIGKVLYLALSSITQAEEGNMTLMCQTQRPLLAQHLPIVQPDQHFLKSKVPHPT